MDSEKNMKKRPKRLYIVLPVIFVIVLAVAAGIMVYNRSTEKTAEKEQEDLSARTEKAVDSKQEKTEDDILKRLGIAVPEKDLNWEELWKENVDIYAWIYIPGTSIDYPVLQHAYDDAFYLEHNLDGSQGYPGCIYTEMANNMQFQDRNTVIYGHDMKDGSMFHSLHNFEEEAFFNENRYVFIYTPEQVYVYDIFAAYEFSDKHILNNYNFISDAGYQEYLDMVFQIRDMGAHFRSGVEVGIENRIVTLSTCIAEKPDMRYLVQGVLVNDPNLDIQDTSGEE